MVYYVMLHNCYDISNYGFLTFEKGGHLSSSVRQQNCMEKITLFRS